MDIEEALKIIDTALKPDRLSDVQELVFRQCWNGQTYQEIAEAASYDADYIRVVGFQLWQMLSKAFGEKVTKHNFRAVLRDSSLTSLLAKPGEKTSEYSSTITDSSEFPEGLVPLDSLFYIDRPPIEQRAYQEILKPGSLIRIRAPRQMGKTSLMMRILNHATAHQYRTVRLNLEQADEDILINLDKFLRWICASVSYQLKLEPKLDDYWDDDLGSKLSCTTYFQTHLLEQTDSELVVALDEVNRIFEYPKIAQDFLPLLRSWHEEAKDSSIWQKLRLLVVHSTEIYIPLNINQSPFNVGLPIRLQEFNQEQVQELAERYGLNWKTEEECQQLMAMVGGHPYLVRLALYYLVNPPVLDWGGLNQLLAEAPTEVGIYSHHLRRHLSNLLTHLELIEALKQVVNADNPVRLEPMASYKLDSMGLVKLEGYTCTPSCQLYRLYFGDRLNSL